MWYFMLNSGSCYITGVLLAFVIPFGNGGKKTSSYRLQHFTQACRLTSILLANTYSHKFNWYEGKSPNTLGIMFGDWETTGIWLFSLLQ
jgi:NhaA family Na+:H+ antiporter